MTGKRPVLPSPEAELRAKIDGTVNRGGVVHGCVPLTDPDWCEPWVQFTWGAGCNRRLLGERIHES